MPSYLDRDGLNIFAKGTGYEEVGDNIFVHITL